jgi:hypothetical protein
MPAGDRALSPGYTGQMKAATGVTLHVLGTAPMVVSSQDPAPELLQRGKRPQRIERHQRGALFFELLSNLRILQKFE